MATNRNNSRNMGRTGARMASRGAGITRGRFLRTAGITAAGLGAAAAGLGGVAHATGGSTTVIGTGNSPNDAELIQAAVSNQMYDTVYLQGSFNFGQNDSVEITRDIEIIGQGATIIGGDSPILCDTPSFLKVRNLRIEGATFAGIYVTKSSGLEITGCEIVNIRGTPAFNFPPYFTFASPIFVSAFQAWNPNNTTGDMLIEGNYLSPNENLDPQFNSVISYGIGFIASNPRARIIGNEIVNVNYVGIAFDSSPGTATISNNTIRTGPAQVPWFSYGTGIAVGIHTWFPTGSSNVSGNYIETVNPEADGISFNGTFLDGASHLILQNHINMTGSNYGALSCYDATKNTVWKGNKVEGSMFYAQGIIPNLLNTNYVAENNVYQGNNIAPAQAEYHVLCHYGANNNMFVGYSGNVLDLGEDNRITGYTTMAHEPPPNLGQRISKAQHRIRDWGQE